MTITSIEVGDALTVHWSSGGSSRFEFLWLRDNARDPVSFDLRSHQRRVYTAEIDADIRPAAARLIECGLAVAISWPDLATPSHYPSEFLLAFSGAQTARLSSPEPWTHQPGQVTYHWDRIRTQPDLWLETLARRGIVHVTDCPISEQSVETIANHLGYIRQSIFGDIWTFEANAAMDDSAYSSEALRPHTDGAYSFDPPGVQILLCLEKDGTGGASILVDGYEIAEGLARDSAMGEALRNTTIDYVYKGDGVTLQASHPILTRRAGRADHIVFNNYDRRAMSLGEDRINRFYDMLRQFDRAVNNPEHQWQYTLQAGEALIIDNWRVLHGRSTYSGSRRMTGAYINREDVESRWRRLAGIPEL
ncbi:MAG: TauD/TfdA family dioxygenase [Pseudomonadota bacterium]